MKNSLIRWAGNGLETIEFAGEPRPPIRYELRIRRNSLFFSLLAGNLTVETGSTTTASATTHILTTNYGIPVANARQRERGRSRAGTSVAEPQLDLSRRAQRGRIGDRYAVIEFDVLAARRARASVGETWRHRDNAHDAPP